MFFDWGNPAIQSTLVTGLVSNPSTASLINEIDSTQLGTATFITGQSRNFHVTWIAGASTNAVWLFEHATSTALAASTTTIMARTPTGQSAQFVSYHTLGPNDRLRIRVNSSFTGDASAFIQAQPLT